MLPLSLRWFSARPLVSTALLSYIEPKTEHRLLHDSWFCSTICGTDWLHFWKYCCMQKDKTLLTSAISPSTPHGVHQRSTAPRCGPKEPSSGTPHHGSIVGPWSLASHPPPGQLIVGPDLITTALKNLYIPVILEARGVDVGRGEG